VVKLETAIMSLKTWVSLHLLWLILKTFCLKTWFCLKTLCLKTWSPNLELHWSSSALEMIAASWIPRVSP
jgi:hypothetical protein